MTNLENVAYNLIRYVLAHEARALDGFLKLANEADLKIHMGNTGCNTPAMANVRFIDALPMVGLHVEVSFISIL